MEKESSMTDPQDEELLTFFEEEDINVLRTVREWKVLIVDDDDDVHQATVLALSNTPILNRTIKFLHAYSAKQALECLQQEVDVAVILLDVVMEREDAGLKLVRTIREDLGLRDLRIILRTGQPGYAPEIDAIRDYDINDYKTKSELSRSGLYTTLTSSIRSYEQIHTLNVGRRGLDMIIQASGQMMTHQSMREFASGIISEISGLLRLDLDGLVCARERSSSGQLTVIAASGRFAQYIDQPIDTIDDSIVMAALNQTLRERHNQFNEESSVLFFSGKSGNDLIAYLETGTPLDEMNLQLLEVFCTNIAINLDNVALFDQLHDHAYNDQLLHIPNRLAFMRAVGDTIAARKLSDTVAVVDIDHFSHLNDALGHRYGDSLLKGVCQRLIENLPEDTIIARLAADTFGLLGANATITPGTLLPLFREPFVIDGAEQSLSATIGFARLSEVDGNGSEAVKSANIALNLAKNTARGEGCYFTRNMEFETRARMRLLRELRSAFDRERLFVVYQPQFCLKDRTPIGVEALLRWRTDEGIFVAPDQFIPLAESSGLIVGLGKWVLRTACHDLQRLTKEGFRNLRMAVNVSVMQFRSPGFLDIVDNAISESGIDPRMLELEITESVAMLDANFMLATINRLKERNIAIAIDDFGTGFSSLSYLERLNVDRLKIDQSFISQMMQTNSSLRIVETIVQLGHSLKLQVIAEGVEQSAQADLLTRLGCHEGQGYLFARPMAFRQLKTLLTDPSNTMKTYVPPPIS